MWNPDCRPEIGAAAHCLSGWESKAVCQASTLRGVAIRHVVTSGGRPSRGGGASCDCCSLQNCCLRMGAMAVTAGHWGWLLLITYMGASKYSDIWVI